MGNKTTHVEELSLFRIEIGAGPTALSLFSRLSKPKNV